MDKKEQEKQVKDLVEVVEALEEQPVEKKKFSVKCKERCKSIIAYAKGMRLKRIAFVLVMLAAVTVGMYFVFREFGFDIFADEAPDLEANGFVLAMIFIGIYLVQCLTLNLLPGTTTFFISFVAFNLFGGWGNFLVLFSVSVAAVLIGSVALYCLGRFGGRKLLYWLFNKEALDKRLDWFARNGSRGVPWLFLIPLFPTDLLCLVCGASKMRFWQFLMIVVVFRPIEITLLLLYPEIIGSNIVQEQMYVWQRILVVNVLIINVVLLVLYHRGLIRLFNRTFNRKRYHQDIESEQRIHEEEIAKIAREVAREAIRLHIAVESSKDVKTPGPQNE